MAGKIQKCKVDPTNGVQWTVVVIHHHKLEEIRNNSFEDNPLETGLNELRNPEQYFFTLMLSKQLSLPDSQHISLAIKETREKGL